MGHRHRRVKRPPPPTGCAISPSAATIPTGGSQQFTATVTPASAGQDGFWFSSDPAAIAIDGRSGLATTGPVPGTATITFAPLGHDTLSATATAGSDELSFLRANLSGTDLPLEVYSAASGVTIANTDEATHWTGLMGTGPTWTVGGYPPDPDLGVVRGLQVVGTDPTTRYLATGADRGLSTPLSSLFNWTTCKAYVIVGVVNSPIGTTQQSVLAMQGNATGGRPLGAFGEKQYDASIGVVRCQFLDQGGVSTMSYPALRRAGPKRRVFIPSNSDGYTRLDSPPVVMDDVVYNNTPSPLAPSDAPVSLYIPRGNYAEIRAIVPLPEHPSQAAQAVWAEWGRLYHGAINNADICVMWEGDSLTHGGALPDMRQVYAANVVERAAYLGTVEDTNFGCGGAKIGTYPLNPLESFTSTVARRMEYVIASFAQSPATTKILGLLIGTNDISYTGTDAATLAAAIFVQVDRFLAADPIHQLILGTIFANAVHDATMDQVRRDTNVLLKSGAASRPRVTIADYASIPELDTLADTANLTNYIDGTHITPAANVLLADLLDPILAGLVA